MNRPTILLGALALGACLPSPGIIGATASESGAGDGSGDDASPEPDATSSTSPPHATSDSGDEPRLDVGVPGGGCDGPCGIDIGCGSMGNGRAIAMHPEGGSAGLMFDVDLPRLSLLVGESGYHLEEAPVAPTRLDLAVDSLGRAAVLADRNGGYVLQLRAPPEFEVTWARAHVVDERHIITSDIATSIDGSLHVVGTSIDLLEPSSTQIVVHTYGSDGALVGEWSEAGDVAPLLATDHVDGSVVLWTAAEDSPPDEHAYRFRRLDATGTAAESLEASFGIEVVGRPSRREDGWLVVGAAGNGIEVHALTNEFDTNTVFSSAPDDVDDIFHPRSIIAVGVGWVVFVQRPGADGWELQVLAYDADGTRIDPEGDNVFGGWNVDSDVLDVATHDGREIHFLIGPPGAVDSHCELRYPLE